MIEEATKPTPKHSRKQKLVLQLFFLLAMGALAIWMSGGFRREPLYKGLPISYWVDRACLGYEGNVWSNRLEVKNIGPVAVPYLVERLRTTDGWRSKWNSLRTHLPSSWQQHFPAKPTAKQIHDGAARTLAMLGPDAKSAVPDLMRLLPEVDAAGNSPAVDALGAIGPDARGALPALHGVLTNQNGYFRVEVARALWQVGRETNQVLEICTNMMVIGGGSGSDNFVMNACAALMDLGVAAAPAVPRALMVLQDTNSNGYARGNAAGVLGATRVSTTEIRAAPLDGVKPGQDKQSRYLQSHCALALWQLDSQYAPLATRLAMEQIADDRRRLPGSEGDFVRWLQYRGLDPKESIPTLTQLLESDSAEVREAAAEALAKIEAQTKSGAKQ